MARLEIRKNHALALDEAREGARRVGAELESGYGMLCRWEGDVLRFDRLGVEGELRVFADRIEIDMDLGALLAGFAPAIQGKLERQFERYFGS